MTRKNTDDRKPLKGSKALSSRRQDCARRAMDFRPRIPGSTPWWQTSGACAKNAQEAIMVAPKLGVKMRAADAKAYIDAVNEKLSRWNFADACNPVVFQKLGQLHRRDQHVYPLSFLNWSHK
jgi:hypothetical protein